MGSGGCRNLVGGEEDQHRPCKRSSSSSSERSLDIQATHCIQKAQEAASMSWKCSRTERPSLVSQADDIALYKWRAGLSWCCIYRYSVGMVLLCFLLIQRMDACWDACFPRSKKGGPFSSYRSFSRVPGGQTDPGSCQKPAESPQEIGASGKVKQSRTNLLKERSRTYCIFEAGYHLKKLSQMLYNWWVLRASGWIKFETWNRIRQKGHHWYHFPKKL